MRFWETAYLRLPRAKCWLRAGIGGQFPRNVYCPRLQNSPYFFVFKYERAVKQKVCNEAEKTLTPRFTDFFTDFEKKPTVLQSNTVL